MMTVVMAAKRVSPILSFDGFLEDGACGSNGMFRGGDESADDDDVGLRFQRHLRTASTEARQGWT